MEEKTTEDGETVTYPVSPEVSETVTFWAGRVARAIVKLSVFPLLSVTELFPPVVVMLIAATLEESTELTVTEELSTPEE